MAKQVEQYTIDMQQVEASLQRVDSLAKLMKKSLKEIGGEFEGLSKTNVDASGKLIQYSDAIEKKGIKSLKEFRQEQRTQNFITREGTQAITNMVFALGFLSQGNKNAQSTTRSVAQAMLAGVAAQNAMEFSLFSLGKASGQVGGKLGGVLAKVSSMAGPISLVVGLTSAFVAFFTQSSEAAGKAADEGLARFNAEIQGLSGSKIKLTSENIKRALDAVRKESVDLQFNEGFIRTPKPIGPHEQERLDILKEAEKILASMLDAAKAQEEIQRVLAIVEQQRSGVMEKQRGHLATVNEEIAKQKEKLKDITLNDEQIRAINDRILQLEQEKARILQTTADLRKKERSDREEEVRFSEKMEGADDARRAGQEKARRAREKNEEERENRRQKADDAAAKRIDRLHKKEQEFLSTLQQNFSELNQALGLMGVRGDSMVAKLINSVQFAIQLGKQLNEINKAKAAGEAVGLLSFLGPFASILGIFGSLAGKQSGGWTGPGPANKPTGWAHADEVYFEKSLTQRYRDDLLALRRGMQSGLNVRQAALATGTAEKTARVEVKTRSLEREVRSVKRAIQDLPNVMRFAPDGIARLTKKDERRSLLRKI